MGYFWVGLGIGFLAGAVIFDMAWRYVNRLERKLRERRLRNHE